MASIKTRILGLEIGDRCPVGIMGVINLSPESFYKASVARSVEEAVEMAGKMKQEGASFIDIGAVSTAPQSKIAVPEEKEISRLLPALRAIKDSVDIPVSVDTRRARTASRAVEGGADMINDTSGLKADSKIAETLAQLGVPVIIVAHEPQPEEGKPIERVLNAISESLHIASSAGIKPHHTIIDPGIGFFRLRRMPWHKWNCLVISELKRFRVFARPILVGISRKGFVGKITGMERPEDRLIGSLAAEAVAVWNGAHILRTHDVAATRQVIQMVSTIRESAN